MGRQRGWLWWKGNGLTILSVENVCFLRLCCLRRLGKYGRRNGEKYGCWFCELHVKMEEEFLKSSVSVQKFELNAPDKISRDLVNPRRLGAGV